MTNESTIIIGLLAYILCRECFFLYSTQKLVNKIMCKSFYDYQQANRVGKTQEGLNPGRVQEDLSEDLGSLEGIGLI